MKKLLSSIILFVLAGVNIIFAQNYNLSEISKARLVTEYSANTTVDEMDTVTFGVDKDGSPIEWIVLEKSNNKALLLSKYVLTSHSYNEEYVDITWENCTMRKWLNSEYINTIFSKKEQGSILTTDVINNDNVQYGTKGGNNTKDKLFLLSIDEVNKYFSTDNQRVAINKGGSSPFWWLRSPGYFQDNAADVDYEGYLDEDGLTVRNDSGVRPALWVDTSSFGNAADSNVSFDAIDTASQDVNTAIDTSSNHDSGVSVNAGINVNNVGNNAISNIEVLNNVLAANKSNLFDNKLYFYWWVAENEKEKMYKEYGPVDPNSYKLVPYGNDYWKVGETGPIGLYDILNKVDDFDWIESWDNNYLTVSKYINKITNDKKYILRFKVNQNIDGLDGIEVIDNYNVKRMKITKSGNEIIINTDAPYFTFNGSFNPNYFTTGGTGSWSFFSYLENIKEIDFTNIITSPIIDDLTCFFVGCKSLERIDLSKLTFESKPNVVHELSAGHMFADCISLKEIIFNDSTSIIWNNVSESDFPLSTFRGCNSLQSIYCNEVTKNSFLKDTSLNTSKVKFYSAIGSINVNAKLNQDMSVIESNTSVDLQDNNVSIINEEVYNTTTVRETQQNTQHETEQIIQAEIEKNQSIGSRDFSNLANQLKKARLVNDYSINTTIDEMDTVTFGSYPQFDMSDTKKEPIEWLVVKREGSGVLLLSKYVLDYKQFNEIYEKTDWGKSTLRKWLNEEFFEKAFSDIEKSFIWQKQNNYIARDKDDWSVWGHTNDDYIFLLPVDELKNYFSGSVWNNFWNGRDEKKTEERLATNDTTFARNNKKTWLTNYYQSKNKSFDSNYEKYIKRVEYWGEAMVSSTDAENISDFLGINVTPVDGLYGVRPALWINTWRVNDYVNDSTKVNSTVVKSNDEKINEDFDTNYSLVDASNQNNTIQETKNVSSTINDNNNAQSNVLEENININDADAYQNSGELNNTNMITSSNISEYTIYNTNVNDVKVYNSNSGDKVIGTLKKDAIVFVKNIIDEDKWAEINFNGITGYVKRVWINKIADNEAEKVKEKYLESNKNANNDTNADVNASTSDDYEGFVKPEPTYIYYFHKEFDEQNKKKIDPTVYYYAKQDSSNKIITSIEKKDIRDGLFGSGFFARTKNVYHNIEITFDEETQKRLAKYVDFDLNYRWEERGYEWCLLVGDSMNSLENISGSSLTPRYDVDTNTYMEGASYYQKGKIQLNCSSSYKQDIIYNKLKNAKIIMLTTKNVIKSSEKKIISKELLGGVEKVLKVDTGAKENEPKLNFARAYVDKSTEKAIIEYTKHNRGKYICIIDDFQGIIDYEEEIEEPKDKCSELLIWLYAYDSNAYARYAFEMIKYFKIYGCELDIIYELNTSNGFEDFEKVYKSKGTPYMAKRNEVKVYYTNSEDGEVLDYLYKDRVVFLYEITGDWAKINCFGYTGYVKLNDIYEVKE